MSISDEPNDPKETDAHTPRFDVTPFRSDGGFSTARLELLLGGLLGLAVAIGYGAHWLDVAVPELEWAWVGAGAALLALLAWFATGWAHLRNGGLALLVGFVAGAAVPGSMLYWTCQQRMTELEAEVRRLVPARVILQVVGDKRLGLIDKIVGLETKFPPGLVADLEPNLVRHFQADPKKYLVLLQSNIEQLEARFNVGNFRVRRGQAMPIPAPAQGPVPDLGLDLNAAIQQAVAQLDIWEQLNWRAQQGVELRLPKIRTKIELGYTGTWIYWSIEAAVAAIAVAVTILARSSKPFCTVCNTWLKERELGRLNLNADVAKTVFSTGAVVELATDIGAQQDGPIKVAVAVCPNCAGESDIVVRLKEVTKKEKKKEETKELGQYNYPGPALRVLEALFPKITPEGNK